MDMPSAAEYRLNSAGTLLTGDFDTESLSEKHWSNLSNAPGIKLYNLLRHSKLKTCFAWLVVWAESFERWNNRKEETVLVCRALSTWSLSTTVLMALLAPVLLAGQLRTKFRVIRCTAMVMQTITSPLEIKGAALERFHAAIGFQTRQQVTAATLIILVFYDRTC